MIVFVFHLVSVRNYYGKRKDERFYRENTGLMVMMGPKKLVAVENRLQ